MATSQNTHEFLWGHNRIVYNAQRNHIDISSPVGLYCLPIELSDVAICKVMKAKNVTIETIDENDETTVNCSECNEIHVFGADSYISYNARIL